MTLLMRDKILNALKESASHPWMATSILFLLISIESFGQINYPLRNELLRIYYSDQARPATIDRGKKEDWKQQILTDSLNLIYVSKILDSLGYPGKSIVGDIAYLAPFLVIQHSDLRSQEQYFPMIKKAAEQQELEWRYVAMMIDRIKVEKKQKQIYGTQVHSITDTLNGIVNSRYEFCPIEDEKNVNRRRKEVGLSTIEKYAKHWGIKLKK